MKRLAIALILAGAGAGAAHAQGVDPEVQTHRGPAAELYLRKRPLSPDAPVLDAELKAMLTSTEKARDDKRLQAISLLREFLGSNPTGESRAEGTFKLAELLWEEARRTYLNRMDDFSRALEGCKETESKKAGSCEQPKEPRIDLKEAEGLYKELHDQYPDFRRMDLVTYLIGFAAKEDSREDDAMAKFEEVIQRFPRSPLIGDSWMMVGEHYFAKAEWPKALDAYKNIHENAATYDLALFKTAWCEWKLGNTDQAARDFKGVLDKAVEAERSGTEAQRRRSSSLRDEALEYLVVVFTEDRSISAKEVFDFLASIGGERYSRDVLIKVAESYAGQTEWARSGEAYQFLIKMDPDSIKAAEYQRMIVTNWNSALDLDKAQQEIKVLLTNYGPGSPWAKAQKNREALARSLDTTEDMVRVTATTIHAEAQSREKALHLKLGKQEGCPAKPPIPADLQNVYARAATAYDDYLNAFGSGKKASEKATEIRYYRADILCFKLGKIEEAGDEYLAVGRSQPVGKLHKDALLAAMNAYEEARPKDTAGRRQLYPVDKKFGEAIDLYASLFPADPALVGVLFKNGQMFYDYGEYDEAIKRFGVIVTKYPNDANAAGAGDRILSALAKAQDYENIDTWARRLKKAPSFAAKDQQERLDKLIIEAIGKSGDKYADAGKFEKAADFYLRVPKEFPDNKGAAQSMMNAGVMYEKAKLPEKAADVYLEIADKFGSRDPELGEKAAFAAGQVYEKVIYYDRAAKAYELLVDKFNKGSKTADALYNAGLLRQALGQNTQAIQHYQDYARRFKDRKDAPDVAFNIGVVYEDAGNDAQANEAFTRYAAQYRSTGKRIMEAHTRAGRTAFRAGQLKKAKEEFQTTLALWKHANGKEKADGNPWAAEAQYYMGELIFREYEKVTLDVKPKELEHALATKSKLLAEAEKVYSNVVDYKDLKWAVAAIYRVGQVYDGFSDALTNAATPTGLTPDQAQAYHDTLDTYVVDIQSKAVERFAAGYQKAIQMQVYDQYTAKIREALGRLASDKYPPEKEARSKERVGDRAPAPELVTEIAR